MKPASIVFMIISVVVIAGGILCCVVGANMASSQGIELFEQTKDVSDNYVFTEDISGLGYKKIVVKTSGAEINIIGDSDNDKIELVNFSAGSYDVSKANLVYTVDDSFSVLRVFEMNKNGFKFQGLRQYLHSFETRNKKKVVNIYVSDTSELKIFEIDSSASDVKVGKSSIICDYNVTLDAGNVTFTGVSTNSDITIKTGEGTINIESVTGRRISCENTSGDILMSSVACMESIQIKQNAGNAVVGIRQNAIAAYDVSAATKNGSVSVSGKSQGGSYEAKADMSDGGTARSLTVSTELGDITIS